MKILCWFSFVEKYYSNIKDLSKYANYCTTDLNSMFNGTSIMLIMTEFEMKADLAPISLDITT